MDGFIKNRLSNPAFGATKPRGDALFLQRDTASLKRVRDEAKQGPCWEGYEKVKGKGDYEDDSCKKSSSGGDKKEKKEKKYTRPSKTKKDEESDTDTEPEKKSKD